VKKLGFMTFLIAAALLVALNFPAAAAGPKVSGPTASAAIGAPVVAPALPAAAVPAPHPHVHEALEAMRDAKRHLETADHDFHGHRVKAIEHLSRAIREAEICEQEP
jgi:hypothetical protein